jgi:hypothetical protein
VHSPHFEAGNDLQTPRTFEAQTQSDSFVNFEVIGRIRDVETIAVGPSIRENIRLRKQFGVGRWRKMKGVADFRLADGTIRVAEIHWYEAHGIGKRKLKLKRFLD